MALVAFYELATLRPLDVRDAWACRIASSPPNSDTTDGGKLIRDLYGHPGSRSSRRNRPSVR
jgi:hypothetical protein